MKKIIYLAALTIAATICSSCATPLRESYEIIDPSNFRKSQSVIVRPIVVKDNVEVCPF